MLNGRNDRLLMSPGPALPRRVAYVVALLLVLPVAGCFDAEETTGTTAAETDLSTPRRVVVLGVDGLSWRVLRPLLARKQLPNLASLMAAGSSGILRTTPKTDSIQAWVTLMTGAVPERHGMVQPLTAATYPTAERLRVPTLWAHAATMVSVGAIGWWATTPANLADGWIMPDIAFWHPWQAWRQMPRQVQQQAQLQAFSPPVSRAPEPRDWPALDAALAAVDAQRVTAALEMLQQHGQPELLGLLLTRLGPLSHGAWQNRQPGPQIEAAYRDLDAHIGALVQRLDPTTIWILASPYGFREGFGSDGPLPSQRSALHGIADYDGFGYRGRRDQNGVIIVAGPGIVAAVRVRAATIDVAPTVAALLSLPPLQHSAGQVMHGLLNVEALRAKDVRQRDGQSERPQVLRRPADTNQQNERMQLLGGQPRGH